MNTCNNCGTVFRDGAKFCPSCGTLAPVQRMSAADFAAGAPRPPRPQAAAPAPTPYDPGYPPPQPVAPFPPYGAQPPQPAAATYEPDEPTAFTPQPAPAQAAGYQAAAPMPAAPAPAGVQAVPLAFQGGVTELDRSLARSRSYIGPAVLVFFLYQFGYVPGLVVNLLYINEAKTMEARAGEKLPGTGCLSTLLWVGVIVTILIAVVSYLVFSALGSVGSLF